MKYVIGNWKANKNLHEAQGWIESFKSEDVSSLEGQVEIIICPPYPYIPLFHDSFKGYSHVHVGAQDTSVYGAGQYTGEVAAHTLDGLIEYVLIGHSERRKYFHETDATVDQKVQQARSINVEPIVLVRGTSDQIPDGVRFVTYEPVEAIGTGDAADATHVVAMRHTLGVDSNMIYIYGGSVNSKNAHDYLQHPTIDGVLPGKASLDPHEFYTLARSCTQS